MADRVLERLDAIARRLNHFVSEGSHTPNTARAVWLEVLGELGSATEDLDPLDLVSWCSSLAVVVEDQAEVLRTNGLGGAAGADDSPEHRHDFDPLEH